MSGEDEVWLVTIWAEPDGITATCKTSSCARAWLGSPKGTLPWRELQVAYLTLPTNIAPEGRINFLKARLCQVWRKGISYLRWQWVKQYPKWLALVKETWTSCAPIPGALILPHRSLRLFGQAESPPRSGRQLRRSSSEAPEI